MIHDKLEYEMLPNICAYPDCKTIVSEDQKYCNEHNTRDRSNLVAVDITEKLKSHRLIAILRCPQCNFRYEVDYEEWCKTYLEKGSIKMQCTNPLCDRVDLVYHKDKTDDYIP